MFFYTLWDADFINHNLIEFYMPFIFYNVRLMSAPRGSFEAPELGVFEEVQASDCTEPLLPVHVEPSTTRAEQEPSTAVTEEELNLDLSTLLCRGRKLPRRRARTGQPDQAILTAMSRPNQYSFTSLLQEGLFVAINMSVYVRAYMKAIVVMCVMKDQRIMRSMRIDMDDVHEGKVYDSFPWVHTGYTDLYGTDDDDVDDLEEHRFPQRSCWKANEDLVINHEWVGIESFFVYEIHRDGASRLLMRPKCV